MLHGLLVEDEDVRERGEDVVGYETEEPVDNMGLVMPALTQ